MDVDATSETLQASNILDNVYTTFDILEGEFSSPEMQAGFSKNGGKLQIAFNTFQNIMKTCKRQATLTVFTVI